MSDDLGDFFALPPFKPDEALVQLRRQLKELKLQEQPGSTPHRFALKGVVVAELQVSADATKPAVAAAVVKRPLQRPEWVRQQLLNEQTAIEPSAPAAAAVLSGAWPSTWQPSRPGATAPFWIHRTFATHACGRCLAEPARGGHRAGYLCAIRPPLPRVLGRRSLHRPDALPALPCGLR